MYHSGDVECSSVLSLLVPLICTTLAPPFHPYLMVSFYFNSLHTLATMLHCFIHLLGWSLPLSLHPLEHKPPGCRIMPACLLLYPSFWNHLAPSTLKMFVMMNEITRANWRGKWSKFAGSGAGIALFLMGNGSHGISCSRRATLCRQVGLIKCVCTFKH